MTDDILLREDTGAVVRLTLNNPRSLNALSEAMLDALSAELSSLGEDTGTRAVILRGSGRAFCAGHDLKEMTAGRQTQDGGRAYFRMLFDKCAAMMASIRDLPQPVIAQVHGLATAAGCQLVASCDLAFAARGTRFGVNGVDIGLFCSTPMVALSRNIPAKHAFEMLTTGDFIEACRARDIGLVNRVLPEDELDEGVLEFASQIAGKLGAAVRIGKRAYYRQLEMGLADAYAYTGEVMTENMLHPRHRGRHRRVRREARAEVESTVTRRPAAGSAVV